MKAPNMVRMGPELQEHLMSCLRCWATLQQRVKVCVSDEHKGKVSGLPERAGLTCPFHSLGWATLRWTT